MRESDSCEQLVRKVYHVKSSPYLALATRVARARPGNSISEDQELKGASRCRLFPKPLARQSAFSLSTRTAPISMARSPMFGESPDVSKSSTTTVSARRIPFFLAMIFLSKFIHASF